MAFPGAVHKTPKEIAEMQRLIDQGLLPKDAIEQHYENETKSVFGENYKTDRNGDPIEQGIGSKAQPSRSSIEAYRKYGQREKDYEANLQRMEEELAAYQAKQPVRRKPGRLAKVA